MPGFCQEHVQNKLDITWTDDDASSMSTSTTQNADRRAAPRHPIAVVAERTGLSPDVLRVWERRYGAVAPARGAGGHRLYSDRDIERLRLLRAAVRAGRGIGLVARLDEAALARTVADDRGARAESETRDAPAPARGQGDAEAAEAVVERALALTAALDARELDGELRRAATRLGVTVFLERVAAPLLRRVGDEWHAGRLSPAQEHLAAATLHDLLVESMRSVAPARGAPRVVVATPAGERHAIGAAFAGAAAAAQGWSVIYLGADLPAGEIAAAAAATEARVVALSLLYVDDRERLLGELRTLRARLLADVPLLAGGAGAVSLAAELRACGVRVGESLGELREALDDASPAGKA